METKVVKTNVNPAADPLRLLTAREALETPRKTRDGVALVHTVLYTNCARIYYIEKGFHRKHAKIELGKLVDHVLATYGSTEVSDVTVYDFIDENLRKVCISFLEAGKEIIPL